MQNACRDVAVDGPGKGRDERHGRQGVVADAGRRGCARLARTSVRGWDVRWWRAVDVAGCRGNQGAEGFSPAFCADGVGPGLRVRFVSTARARGARGMADSILEVWGDGLSQQQCNTHTQLLSTSVVWAVQGL